MVDAPLSPSVLAEEAPRRRPAFGYGLVLAAVALWSVNAGVAKVVVESGGLSTLRLAELRAAGSALLLFGAVAAWRPGSLRLGGREALFVGAFGIAGLAFVHFFYFVAITRLEIGIALVIEYLAPVLIAVWARFFIHEPVRRRMWLALALALAGLGLVVELPGGGALDGLGVAAALAGAFAYALYILMADHSLRGGRDVFSLLAWGFVFAALFWSVAQPWWSYPFGLLQGSTSLLGRLESLSLPLWALAAYVVVFGTIVPFLLIVSALHHVDPTRVTIVAMSEPVLAGFVGYAWLEEELGPFQIAGGLLVLAGILLAQTARERSRA